MKPELDKSAIVGHSAGGQITANLAALASSVGLPEPRAIMCIQPGKSWSRSERIAIPLEDLSKIPKNILLLAVMGDRDIVARDIDAKRIFNETPQIPTANKNFVILVSDDHGEPALVANHFAPVAYDKNYDSPLRSRIRERLESRTGNRPESDEEDFPNLEADNPHSVNALDYYGLWKLFDGLYEAAFPDLTNLSETEINF
ncbi:MAG: alpha/beta hydrolase [Nitrospira sp.]|nr:alpha/beta hydrolase [Nitrospira sp.]